MQKKIKIAFVLQERFEVFELARAFIERGHDVTVFINYPAFALRRFCFNPGHSKRFVLHGIAARVFASITRCFGLPFPEKFLSQWFGRWAARQLRKEKWDVVVGMSGVSLDFLMEESLKNSLRIVVRASAHIRAQKIILEEEEKRVGAHLDKPSPWMLEREAAEYALADKIRVLSAFSYDSFVSNGIDKDKLWFHASAFPTAGFKTTSRVFDERRKRILEQGPLRVLYVGNLSFQKGLMDLKEVALRLDQTQYVFRLVGAALPEASALLSNMKGRLDICGKKTQSELPLYYEWADIFLYLTIQDGFPQVLAQAHMSGLPVFATRNSAAPDFIEENMTGWLFPIHRPDLVVEKLQWCYHHRKDLAAMVDKIEQKLQTVQIRTWDNAAEEAEVFLGGLCH